MVGWGRVVHMIRAQGRVGLGVGLGGVVHMGCSTVRP